MPYTSDGKYFPYTADGILASKRHQMNLDAEKRTMGKQRPRPEDMPLPPGVKPRHLDPNHPMNRENNRPPENDDNDRTPRRRMQGSQGAIPVGYKEGFGQIGAGMKEIGRSIKESMTPSQKIVKKGGENARNVTPEIKRIGR